MPLAVKIVVAVLVLVALQYHRWSRLSSGSMFSPEFPRPVVALFNWAFGAIVLLALLQLLLDAGLLVAALIHGGFVGAPDGVRYAMAALAAIAAAIGVQQAMRVPPLKDVEVAIRGLPPQFDGYTILQLTDLHISRLFPASWARAVVERSNELGVDLIAITGDLIDGTLEARRADIEPLRDLKAADGVYVISGNHEYIFGYDDWMAHYAALGLRSLENRHIVLERDGGKLVLAGITDRASRHRGHPVRDLAAVLAGAPKGAPVILLDHQPGDARNAAKLGVALQLSGHTHGGLIVGHRPAGRTRQCRLRLGPLRRRRDDALRQQRHRAVARLRAAARPSLRVDADHAAPGRRGLIRQIIPRRCRDHSRVVRSWDWKRQKELPMAKLIFINLPVSDLARATAFYQAIGAVKNPQFSGDTASCMVFSDTIHVMLMTHDKYRYFTTKKIADAKTTSQVLLCITADSRAEVDDIVGKAGARRRRDRSVTRGRIRLHVWPQFRGSRRPSLGRELDRSRSVRESLCCTGDVSGYRRRRVAGGGLVGQIYRGTGSGVISLPLKPLARSFGASSSAMCQEKMMAQSGWSSNMRLSSTTGISVPGMHLPIFSEPSISQT